MKFPRFLSIVLLIGFFSSCSSPESTRTVVPAEFSDHISGYTSGQISANGEIAITLANDVDKSNRKTDGLFKLNPNVAGETRWVSSNTVIFDPKQKLESGQEYEVLFMLNELYELEEEKSVFAFEVATIKQNFEVEFDGIETLFEDRNKQRVSGTIYTADVADLENIRRVLSAEQPNQDLEIQWTQDGQQQAHHFQISGIQRLKEPSKFTVSWDGTPIGASTSNQRVFEIIPAGVFELMDVTVFRDKNPRVELIFSDPLDPDQNLNGLIRIGETGNQNFIIHGNKIIVNPRQRKEGEQTLYISAGIKNKDGKELNSEFTRQIQFFQPKPQIELIGNGTIIPRSKKLLLPFKAVSLGAVDVHVTRIFENNIGQFFQENNLSEVSRWNVRKVGRVVFTDVIPFSTLGSVDPGKWNNYALDLSNLIEPEPGAIYQVELSFRSHQAVYPCAENNEISNSVAGNSSWKLNSEDEQAYWDNYSNYYYPAGYDWQERENPCHVSYYNSDRRRAKNVLATDLGIIAKRADDNNLTIFVSNLLTAQSESGVKVEAFDFQQQSMVTGNTDVDGKVLVQTPRTPFYVIATKGGQKAYLKLNDGSSLSMSDFDVSGAANTKGIKGFLYGERGVWRPGDSLFVSLILEDEHDVLPDDHPITFELHNPSGQVVDRQTFSSGLNGMYVYKTETEAQAPTGNWQLEAKIGGISFSKSLKIESVKPNRLKVDVDFADDAVTVPARELNAELSSQWLHGATARNLKADVEMSLRPAPPTFSDYPNFSFSDETVSFSSESETIFEGTLNEEGTVEFTHKFNRMSEGPARVLVNLRTRVFEPSGNFSIGQASTYFYPFRTIVGIRPPQSDEDDYWNWLDRNEPQEFEVVSINANENRVLRKELQVEVYQIRWRWWWERGSEDLSSYFERENVRRISSSTVNTGSDGIGEFIIELPENADGGRYLVRVKDPQGGHSASSIVYFSWYGGRTESVSPARLTFNSDKESYEVGDEITLNIPSSEKSRILVSLESGSKILNTTWLHGHEEETEFTFTANENMVPNIYAHVMHIQPHGQQENDLPIRMYGVIPITVENPETILQPVVKLPDEIRPESTVEIEVSEENNRAMTYTIAMVDEGLLDLTNFRTPEPHNHFYAREALGVKTWDVFDDVSSPYGENLSRILSIGGDASEVEVDPLTEANRFEPMVRFEGPFELEAGTVNRHQISIPNYVGSVRTMVIARSNGAYGQAQETTPVKKPVMVLATLPRVLGPGETVDLPVSVFAMNDDIENVQVQLETNELFEIQSDASATLHFEEQGDQLQKFKLQTDTQVGVGNIRVDASSGNEEAYDEIEIAVRNPNTPFVDVKSAVLQEDESWELEFEPQGMVGTNSAMLEVSRVPPIDFGKRLRFLLRYPHGCVEQIVSAAFPQLFLAEVMEISDEEQNEIQQNVDEAIKQLSRFLTYNGGLAYWSGHEDANSWGTNYGYHFLLEAQKQGYYVPSTLMRQSNSFQTERARNWNDDSEYQRSDLIQAYRLYTLALANSPALGAMNRMREMDDLSTQAKWRLAAAYAAAGQAEAAENLIQNADVDISEYRELSHSYGSASRDQAMILETLSILGWEDEAALLARELSSELSSERWMSTQTTAFGLIAVSKYLEKFTASGQLEASFSIDGNSGSINSNAVIAQIPITINEYTNNNFQLINNSNGTLFTRLILEGTPLLGDTISASNSLNQRVRFINLNGEEISIDQIEQGTDFVAEVMVSNPGLRGNYEELVLTQIFPSGWEIRNTRLEDASFSEASSAFEYQDIRDDRIFTYFDLRANQSKTFRVQLNASYAGRFYLSAFTTQAMYDETINARSAGKWVEVEGN